MVYSTTWYHLDKNNNIIAEHKNKACFGHIISPGFFEKKCQYLLYDFSYNMEVTQEEARQYFLFLKSIPEFTELMPKSCTELAKTGKYKVDLHKFNGTKIFTILTLIRAVVEDKKTVREVITFDRKFNYSLSNFGILKMCGSVHTKNNNHWITQSVDKPNLSKMFNVTTHWKAEKPCIETGLGRHIHSTFSHPGDGYATKHPVDQNTINSIRAEKEKPKVKKLMKQKQYDNSALQLGF